MAKFNDVKIPQLQMTLKQRGLATNGVKSEIQLREAMKSENINVEKYFFQLDIEKGITRIKEKKET